MANKKCCSQYWQETKPSGSCPSPNRCLRPGEGPWARNDLAEWPGGRPLRYIEVMEQFGPLCAAQTAREDILQMLWALRPPTQPLRPFCNFQPRAGGRHERCSSAASHSSTSTRISTFLSFQRYFFTVHRGGVGISLENNPRV